MFIRKEDHALVFMRIAVVIALLVLPRMWPLLAQPDRQSYMADSLVTSELSRLGRLYQLDSTALARYDKIITFNREVYVGKIHNISFSEVRFTCPPDDKLMALNRSAISQILYTSGRRDVFIPLDDRTVKQKQLVDTTRIIVKNQKDWMKVVVTENPDDVTFLRPLGDVEARYEADIGNMGNEEILRRASVILKKKAAAMQAPYVLIETKFFQKSYGELPSVEVTGRVFGYAAEK